MQLLSLFWEIVHHIVQFNQVFAVYKKVNLLPLEKQWMQNIQPLVNLTLTLLSLGVAFARGEFKFKLFLKDLCYESKTLWLFGLFRDFFAEKKFGKYIKFLGGNTFLYRRWFRKKWFTYVGVALVAEVNKYVHV